MIKKQSGIMASCMTSVFSLLPAAISRYCIMLHWMDTPHNPHTQSHTPPGPSTVIAEKQMNYNNEND